MCVGRGTAGETDIRRHQMLVVVLYSCSNDSSVALYAQVQQMFLALPLYRGLVCVCKLTMKRINCSSVLVPGITPLAMVTVAKKSAKLVDLRQKSNDLAG